MSASAQGIDISAFQLDLAVHDLSGLQFAFTKATDGPSGTDPHFAVNWATIKQAGLHRGTYHELQAGNPGGQAAHFLAVARGQRLEPGDMLAVVASDYPGVTDADVLVFCDTVELATKGLNPVLPYTDLNTGVTLRATSRAFGDLWAAWPAVTSPPMPLAGWRTFRLWQWGTRDVPGLGAVDANAYNGTAAEMGAWIATFKPKPAPKPPVPHAACASGDEMFVLCFDSDGNAPLSIPPTLPDGVTQVSGVQVTSTGPASLRFAFGGEGYEPAVDIDWARGKDTVTVPVGGSSGKVQRLDKGSNYVAATFV